MNALSWRTFFVWLFCFEGPKHKIWVIHTFETPASLRVLAQTFNWGSDRNILSGSELRKRNLAIEVFRSQWPTQCAHMSDIPDFNRFSVMILVRYLSEIRYFESRKPIIPTGFRYCVKLHFRHFRFRFLSGWNCFNGLVRNLNLECAWRQSYHSIKRIINHAFLSHGRALRRAARLKPGQLVKETNVQDM